MGLEESRQRKKQGSKNKEIANITKERNHTKRKKISKFENEPRVVLPLKHSSKVRNHNEAKVLAQVSACSKSCSNSRRKCGSGPSGLRTSSNLPTKQKKLKLAKRFTYQARKVEGKQGVVVCPRIGTHETTYSLLARPSSGFRISSGLVSTI
ncbi:hypothetical protein GmHk_15G044915 [Glycine max]|nr:hypothetical protein GmHk_15G044915 [Glycine max]